MKKNRSPLTIILALAGIAIMAYYDTCDTACSYLTGDIWGIDLKWIGIAYMGAIILFCLFKWSPLVQAALAAGLGVEVFLIAFQVREEVYCPFCLAFTLLVITAFIVNYERSSRLSGSYVDKFLYALGEFDWPSLLKLKFPLLLLSLIGYLFVLFSFTGSVTPAYGDLGKSVPSWGSGNYEVLVLSDYFCPSCQILEFQLEPILEDLSANGDVKICFVDVPIHRQTPLYNRFYLYATNADNNMHKVLHARKILFQFARQSPSAKNATEATLAELFKQENINFKRFDCRPVQVQLSRIIREYKINATPTCIVKYSDNVSKEYIGAKNILDGLKTLQETLNNTSQ
ncbi:MAG: thioredoxin domain-containing protein [Deltaproteobacteria bacterium]|nr:thioredoxin domain-containing protein [Deltaproteobacteria bacterium]